MPQSPATGGYQCGNQEAKIVRYIRRTSSQFSNTVRFLFNGLFSFGAFISVSHVWCTSWSYCLDDWNLYSVPKSHCTVCFTHSLKWEGLVAAFCSKANKITSTCSLGKNCIISLNAMKEKLNNCSHDRKEAHHKHTEILLNVSIIRVHICSSFQFYSN